MRHSICCTVQVGSDLACVTPLASYCLLLPAQACCSRTSDAKLCPPRCHWAGQQAQLSHVNQTCSGFRRGCQATCWEIGIVRSQCFPTRGPLAARELLRALARRMTPGSCLKSFSQPRQVQLGLLDKSGSSAELRLLCALTPDMSTARGDAMVD